MKKINLYVSLLFIILSLGLWWILFSSYSDYIFKSWYTTILIPVFDILSIYFAIRSMRKHESSIGTYIGIVGIITLFIILFNVIFGLGWILSGVTG